MAGGSREYRTDLPAVPYPDAVGTGWPKGHCTTSTSWFCVLHRSSRPVFPSKAALTRQKRRSRAFAVFSVKSRMSRKGGRVRLATHAREHLPLRPRLACLAIAAQCPCPAYRPRHRRTPLAMLRSPWTVITGKIEGACQAIRSGGLVTVRLALFEVRAYAVGRAFLFLKA